MIASRFGEQEGVSGELEEWAGREVRTLAVKCTEFGVQLVEIPSRREAIEHEIAGLCRGSGGRFGH